jgi:molybdopterin-containing oxidoreductase family iron-sulfur binding subunit
MVRYGMAIDLTRCMGCRACLQACKVENNTPKGIFWMWVYKEEHGTYPDVKISYMPKNCLQCENPPCVQVCPVSATFQRDDGITLVNYETCIGCKACAQACPYVARYPVEDHNEPYFDKGEGKDLYGAGAWSDGITEEVPYKNPDHDKKYGGNGGQMLVSGNPPYKKVMTKCTFCVHRIAKGLEPACANVCPVNAITFGDLDDPNSMVSGLIAKNESHVLKPHLGTRPKVHYITRRSR